LIQSSKPIQSEERVLLDQIEKRRKRRKRRKEKETERVSKRVLEHWDLLILPSLSLLSLLLSLLSLLLLLSRPLSFPRSAHKLISLPHETAQGFRYNEKRCPPKL
jgi:hypothetical protein